MTRFREVRSCVKINLRQTRRALKAWRQAKCQIHPTRNKRIPKVRQTLLLLGKLGKGPPRQKLCPRRVRAPIIPLRRSEGHDRRRDGRPPPNECPTFLSDRGTDRSMTARPATSGLCESIETWLRWSCDAGKWPPARLSALCSDMPPSPNGCRPWLAPPTPPYRRCLEAYRWQQPRRRHVSLTPDVRQVGRAGAPVSHP